MSDNDQIMHEVDGCDIDYILDVINSMSRNKMNRLNFELNLLIFTASSICIANGLTVEDAQRGIGKIFPQVQEAFDAGVLEVVTTQSTLN